MNELDCTPAGVIESHAQSQKWDYCYSSNPTLESTQKALQLLPLQVSFMFSTETSTSDVCVHDQGSGTTIK